MDQCSSPTRLTNILDQIAANFIALLIWAAFKLLLRYCKPRQDDKKSHCDDFTQKLKDIQIEQKSQSKQQDKQFNDIISKLDNIQQERQLQNTQADDSSATTSVVRSHDMRSPAQDSATFGADINQTDLALPRDSILVQSMMAQIPPGATHLILHWIFRPRSPPLLSLSPPLEQEVESPETPQPGHQNGVGLGIQPQSLAPPPSNAGSSAQSTNTTPGSSLRRSGESRGVTTRAGKGSATRSPHDPGDKF